MDRVRRRQQRACPPARRRCSQAAGAGGRQRGHAGDQTEAPGRSQGGLTPSSTLAATAAAGRLAWCSLPASGTTAPSWSRSWTRSGCRGRRAGPACKRPDHLVGDKAYSSPTCRRLLRRRGIGHTIPQRSDQRARQARRPGRPLAFDRARHRGRNVVERCCNRLKQFRAVATRYDKRAENYQAMDVIASLLIWLEA
jgi:transposase